MLLAFTSFFFWAFSSVVTGPGIVEVEVPSAFAVVCTIGKSVSLCVDISNWEMFDDDWRLESKKVSPLGEELSLFDRPNEVEREVIFDEKKLGSS
ncbi:hypothetical protein Tco_1079803 [Tanacetum coccineum]|uniref:Secreted protein n=1 Tax=Tanacetum coccineum TaxID=301880 RepID=A0ABQ5HT11_9ASTR